MEGIAEIKKVVYGGWGLAHHQGKTLFIPYTAEGDRVRFSSYRRSKNTHFCELKEVVKPSPLRRQPRCDVFGRCGGCHLLHVSYRDEIEIKRKSVLETLQRIGKISTSLTGIIPSPERWGYRNHAVFRLTAEGQPGFLEAGSSRVVPFPPGGCPLLPAEVRRAIGELPRQSFPPGGEIRVRLDKFGAVNFWGLRDQPGAPDILMSANGFVYPVSPDGFFQVNRLLNDRLIDLVQSLTPGGRRKILDLYCGCGFFTLPLSTGVTEAAGIEIDREAVDNAKAAARLNGRKNVSFRRGEIGEALKDFNQMDTVVADAPREGISRTALKRILSLKPEQIVIISCEPPTFARDAARLIRGGLKISQIYMIDLFPATYHTELVALFNRNHG